jgi:hypothetical protein
MSHEQYAEVSSLFVSEVFEVGPGWRNMSVSDELLLVNVSFEHRS